MIAGAIPRSLPGQESLGINCRKGGLLLNWGSLRIVIARKPT